MPVPEWADEELSAALPVLCAQGESQELEYIREFPSNTHELAKEIAAFASSNAGTILLGVEDSGALRGLQQAATLEERDQLLRRLQGLTCGPVQPAVTVRTAFGLCDSKVVLVLQVPRGDQPIYYVNGKPYIRDLTSARPARPHEVIARVRDWLGATGIAGPTTVGEDSDALANDLLTRLAWTLTRIQLWGQEADARPVQPGFGLMNAEFESAAKTLRDLAAEEKFEAQGLSEDIGHLADALDRATRHPRTLGRESWLAYLEKVSEALAMAESLRARAIDQANIPEAMIRWGWERLKKLRRQLTELANKAPEWARTGRLQELEAEVSWIGLYVLEVAYLALSRSEESWLEELRGVGHRLHLVDQARTKYGSDAIDRVVAIIQAESESFTEVLEAHERSGVV